MMGGVSWDNTGYREGNGWERLLESMIDVRLKCERRDWVGMKDLMVKRMECLRFWNCSWIRMLLRSTRCRMDEWNEAKSVVYVLVNKYGRWKYVGETGLGVIELLTSLLFAVISI